MYRESYQRSHKYFEELDKFENLMADLIILPSSYPMFNDNQVNLSEFTTVMETRVPAILNRSQEIITEALSHMNESIILGMPQDSNFDTTGYCYDNNIETCVRAMVMEKNPVPFLETNYYHHLLSYIKDICKYKKFHVDNSMMEYIDTKLNKFLSDCERFQIFEINPNYQKDESLTNYDSVCPKEHLI